MRTGTQVLEHVRTAALRGSRLRIMAALVLAAASASCGQLQRQGQGSSYLIVSSIEAAPGAEPTKFGGTLLSDVVTTKDDQSGAFNDVAKVSLTLAMKDPGSTTSPTTPTSANYITVDRYHVQFIRADGRNTPGVDVPYPFDGAFTVTVTGAPVEAGFTLVRHTSKEEAPLLALRTSGVIISTLAEVTFYGHDQTGREAIASARIGIDFGNFGDPK